MSFFFPEGVNHSIGSVTDTTFALTIEIFGIGGPEENKYEEGYIAHVRAKVYSSTITTIAMGTYHYDDTTVRMVANIPKKYLNCVIELWESVADTRTGDFDGIMELASGEYRFTSTWTLPAPSSITYPSSINSYYNTTVSWSAVAGADKYNMQSCADNGSWYDYTTITGTSYSPSVYSNATTVKFRVKCLMETYNLKQESAYVTGSVSSVYYTPPNTPPSVPASLTVPTSIRGGYSIPISWGSASDSNLSGYILERSANGGSFQQIYKGANQSYTDTAGTSWSTVQYQVKAYDTYSASSSFRTGDVVNVVQNAPPVISGSDSNLGEKTGAFNQAYTVTDSDAGQTITVVEKVDGMQKRSFVATSGTQYTFSITEAEWLEILNGSHSLTITATDSYGDSVSRKYTFSKKEGEIEIQLVTPLPADDRIIRAIMNVTRTIPEGAIFTVEVCNNGNDAAPTWIDVTDKVLLDSKFFFANAVKTADKWGFNFRIKVQRNEAAGDCYIQGIGGTFE